MNENYNNLDTLKIINKLDINNIDQLYPYKSYQNDFLPILSEYINKIINDKLKINIGKTQKIEYNISGTYSLRLLLDGLKINKNNSNKNKIKISNIMLVDKNIKTKVINDFEIYF